MKKNVFVGGGLPSLVMALYLAKNFPEKEVIVIERDSNLGGTNGSISYDNGEIFDYGMRIYYECNIEEIDKIVENALPKDDILIYSDNCKDPAGCYFNSKIQTYSPCLDLRFLEGDDRIKALGEMMTSKLDINKADYISTKDYLLDRFGKTICEKGFFPILEKLHGKPVSELEIEATSIHFGGEERVILFDEEITKDLMKSELLRRRIAYPNQTNLPIEYTKRVGRAIYPRKYGMQHLIDGLENQLKQAGVEIIRDTELSSIECEGNSIKSISCKNIKSDKTVVYEIENLYWNAFISLLANKLGYDKVNNFERADKTYLAHFVFDKKTNIDDIFYIFNFDEKYSSFRIVNYNGYCPDSSNDGKYRMTVEFWPHDKEVSSDDVFNELINMGVLDADTKVVFSRKEELSNGFPLPTLNNKEIILEYREFINQQNISNLLVFGQFVDDNTFFLPGIMSNAYEVFKKHNLIKSV